ncbi:MAG: hypothetical protein ACD_20C00125G0003 [uncultured bacterium]|nr:MAG: hypothetical protein ACD_20C00125G0003 [uncultured bacterium]HBH18468.1 hypothetical protein [Cyanobacteria bacterium UBA9579]
MPKVSISLPEDIIEFIDEQGKNRSKTIVTILEDYKQLKQKETLEKAYEEYAEFSKEDDKDIQEWEETALKDIGKE